jgi:hypothetical protein
MLLVALAAQKIIWAIGITPSEQKENLPLFFYQPLLYMDTLLLGMKLFGPRCQKPTPLGSDVSKQTLYALGDGPTL